MKTTTWVGALAAIGMGWVCIGCRPEPAGANHRADGDVKINQRTGGTMKKSKSGYDITPLSKDEVATLASKLDPETFRITQKEGTERAFCGTLLDNKK